MILDIRMLLPSYAQAMENGGGMRPAGRAPPAGSVAPPGGHNLRALVVSGGPRAA